MELSAAEGAASHKLTLVPFVSEAVAEAAAALCATEQEIEAQNGSPSDIAALPV
jgi:hypothetical protein